MSRRLPPVPSLEGWLPVFLEVFARTVRGYFSLFFFLPFFFLKFDLILKGFAHEETLKGRTGIHAMKGNLKNINSLNKTKLTRIITKERNLECIKD